MLYFTNNFIIHFYFIFILGKLLNYNNLIIYNYYSEDFKIINTILQSKVRTPACVKAAR